MILLIGGTSCGKSTLAKCMNTLMQYVLILEQSTRLIRPGEVNGKDYWFVSELNYRQQLDNDELIGSMEFNRYQNGECQSVFYGTRKDHIEAAGDKAVLVTNADAAKAIKKYNEEHDNAYKVFIVHVKVNEEEQRERLKNRGDNPIEIDKRIVSDAIALADVDTYVDYTVDNSSTSPGCAAEEIVQAYSRYLASLGE